MSYVIHFFLWSDGKIEDLIKIRHYQCKNYRLSNDFGLKFPPPCKHNNPLVSLYCCLLLSALSYSTMALRVQYFTTQIYFTQLKFQFTQSKIHFTQLGIHFVKLKFHPSGPYFCFHKSLIYYYLHT